jgi:hypothetical protein
VKAKLDGFADPKQAVIKYPESNQSIPAHYARAYAYHVGRYPDTKPMRKADALLANGSPGSILPGAQGSDLLEGGKPKEANRAVAREAGSIDR